MSHAVEECLINTQASKVSKDLFLSSSSELAPNSMSHVQQACLTNAEVSKVIKDLAIFRVLA